MSFPPDLVAEVSVLLHFDLGSTRHGIKIHTTASPEVIAATRRLHAKGLVTQSDGGYLTGLGHEAAGHVQAALTILTSLPTANVR